MKLKINGPIWGYAIRHPSEHHYVFGTDAQELHDKYYEGFNPVLAMVRLDQGKIFKRLSVASRKKTARRGKGENENADHN